MFRKVLKLSASPRALLKGVLALDDSPHAIALGVAIGIFVGLTPTVGVQTILILALVFVSRRVCYFNGAAAMASTYISNPFTMLPMYYFWYQLGASVLPGDGAPVNFDVLLEFDGIVGWWNGMCSLGYRVAVPMCVGAMLTAPIGALAAYPATYFLLKWTGASKRMPSRSDDAAEADVPDTADQLSSHQPPDEPDVISNECTQSESLIASQ